MHVRAWTVIFAYVFMEVFGSIILWFFTAYAMATGSMPYCPRFNRIHLRLATWWTYTSCVICHWIMGKAIYMELDEPLRKGPLILAMRHASTADTPLAATLFGGVLNYNLRLVMKRELLWDPFVEACGTRCRNFFVNRENAVNMDVEVEGLRKLMEGPSQEEDDGRFKACSIYPEGTRKTEAKHQAVLRSLEKSGNLEMLEYARSLKATLPPRLKGLTALIKACPKADVLFLGHLGYDEAFSMATMVNGRIFDFPATFRVFTLHAEDIPRDDDKKMEAAVLRVWKQMDEWVYETQVAIKQDRRGYFSKLHSDAVSNPQKYVTVLAK